MKAKHSDFLFAIGYYFVFLHSRRSSNAEADILSCKLPEVVMTTHPIINNNSVTLFVGPETDISELAPEFTLTPGATISPQKRKLCETLNSPQKYTVTAADGVWKKDLYSNPS